MLLIEMEGDEPSPFHLEFHPRVTVVTGLAVDRRQKLARTLHDLVVGDSRHLVANVDVGGLPQPLTTDLLARLGLLREPVDNVITQVDLPGAVVTAPLGHSDTEQQSSAAVPVGTPMPEESSPLQVARAELHEAELHVKDLEHQLEGVRSLGPTVTDGEFYKAQDALEDARAHIAELNATIASLPRPDAATPTESKAVRLDRLHQIEDTLDERIATFQTLLDQPIPDYTRVRELLTAALETQGSGSVSDRRARLRDLNEQWVATTNEIDRLGRQPRPPQWLVAQTKEQREEAEARITAFTYQLKEGIDVRKALERAKQQLVDANEAWEEIENGIEGEIIAAQRRLDRVVAEIGQFLGLEPGFFVPGVLQQERERLEAIPDPNQSLAMALQAHNVQIEGDSVAAAQRWLQDIAEIEAAQAGARQSLASAIAEQREVRSQIAKLNLEPDQIPEQNYETRLLALREELETALHREADAARLVARLAQQRSTQPSGPTLAELQTALDEALEIVDAAGRKVDYFARLSALRHEANEQLGMSGAQAPAQPVSPLDDGTGGVEERRIAPGAVAAEDDADRPWWERRVSTRPAIESEPEPAEPELDVDLARVTGEDLEMYILARAATLRKVGRNEPIPLILDGTFDQLPHEHVGRVLDALAKVSTLVQIIYLSSGDVAEQWVRSQEETIAATVSVTEL